MSTAVIRAVARAGAGFCGLLAVGQSAQPAAIRSCNFQLDYQVASDALPLESVELWFSLDEGGSWQKYGADADRASPILFTAEREGVYGFYLVLTNAAGTSATPPSAGSQPQASILVDCTPPIVQLHPVEPSGTLGQRVVRLRWTAVDANFGPRPIELAYQPSGSAEWLPISAEPMANTGRFDWRVPDGVTGAVRIRLAAADAAGHRVHSDPQGIELRGAEEWLFANSMPATMYSSVLSGSETVADSMSCDAERARQRASSLFAEAIACRERGEYREAIARLREAVRLQPQMTDAFVELGDVLYRVGDVDRSIEAYELALRQQPSRRAALRGQAKAHAHKKDYSSAARMLRVALRYNPQDGEMWLNLGDVAVYQGDELLAREAYTRATQADPAATRVVAEAQKRLDLMLGVSRTYRSTEP